MDKLDLNTKAQELREMLGEDANSPVDIFSLAKQIDKLTLVFYPLGPSISGMCVRDNKLRLIAINSSMSYGRQRFSLAHELYHLYFDDDLGFNVCARRFDPKSETEKCADQFASYFPAPYKSLKTNIRNRFGGEPLSMADVISLEQYFGMSHLGMLWRLVSENYLDADQLEDYKYGVISMARSMGYDDKLYQPAPAEMQKRTYGYYLQQVEKIRQQDIVSPGKIDELLLDAFRDDIAFGADETVPGGETID